MTKAGKEAVLRGIDGVLALPQNFAPPEFLAWNAKDVFFAKTNYTENVVKWVGFQSRLVAPVQHYRFMKISLLGKREQPTIGRRNVFRPFRGIYTVQRYVGCLRPKYSATSLGRLFSEEAIGYEVGETEQAGLKNVSLLPFRSIC